VRKRFAARRRGAASEEDCNGASWSSLSCGNASISASDAERVDSFVRAMEESRIRCHLNVASVLNCQDGFVCVAVSCARVGARSAGTEVRNLYVAPQHLLLGSDDKKWDAAHSYIFI